MRGTIRLGALALAATMWVGATAATAAPGAPPTAPPTRGVEEHCVVEVVGQAPDGELQLSELVCSSTRPDALTRARQELDLSAATFVIGSHFDGLAFTGSSLNVVGVDCAGGWLNLPAAWNNRISSTANGCPQIRHFDGFFLVTPAQTVVPPGGNLLALDNRTSSIQYAM